MHVFTIAVFALVGSSKLPAVSAEVQPREPSNSSCTFTGTDGHSKASEAKSTCSTIILDSLQVPGGVTLDLEDLNDGTTVCHFEDPSTV